MIKDEDKILYPVWDEEIGQVVLVDKERKEEILRKQIERLLKLGGCVTG